jgi:TAG lipase / steryl ester hydrolase / phospholipase A2 / LPA acyltransferase
MTCAVIGTRSPTELKKFLAPENLVFGRDWKPTTLLERTVGFRRMLTAEDWELSLPNLIPDLTFREAFEISGRHISVSVTPVERHHAPRLLNAITAPHVLIRSAVRASCSVPGLFEPVQLMARDTHGKSVPYLGSRWIDGSFAADLPARQLGRLYGTNHYIVSLINPVMLPLFRDAKLNRDRLLPLQRIVKSTTRHYAKAVDAIFGKYLPASQFGLLNKMLHDLLAQEYEGDISIVPEQRVFSPMRLLSPSTQEEILKLWEDGRRQTWPRIEMIRNATLISRTLDAILERASEHGHIGI